MSASILFAEVKYVGKWSRMANS